MNVDGAGSLGAIVMGLGGLGALVALGLGGFGFTKRRVPLAAFALVPLLVCIVGALTAWSNAGSVLGGLASAEPSATAAQALTGLWSSLEVDMLSRWVAAGVLLLGTWCAGASATLAPGPTEETAMTPVAAGVSAALSILGAIIIVAFGAKQGLNGEAMMLAGVVLVGGLGVAFASVRRALYEHAFRVAGMRFTASALFVIAAWFACRATLMGVQIDMFGPGGEALGVTLEKATESWANIADPAWYLAYGSFMLCFGIAFNGVYAELGEAVQRYTLVDVFATIALTLGLVGARGLEATNTSALQQVGTHGPSIEIFGNFGSELPSTVLQVAKNSITVRPTEGGYGDILVYDRYMVGTLEDGNPKLENEWRRLWKWNGASWDVDGAPLDCSKQDPSMACQPASLNLTRPPLLAIGKSEIAPVVTELLKSSKITHFFLQARATDDDGRKVPEQLKHQLVSFIEFDVNKKADLEKEIWVDAGFKRTFWGPTHWFGEGDDKEPARYQDAVLADSKSPGIHILTGPRSRVEGIANSCVSTVAQVAQDAKSATLNEGLWCNVVEAEIDAWRDEARGIWPVPTPDTVRARVRVEGPIDTERVSSMFLHETGAAAYCQEKAHKKALEDYDPEDEESELVPTNGRMDVRVVINHKGRINGTYVGEKSKLNNDMLARCLAERYRQFSFEPLPMPPVVEGQEKPEKPKVEVFLTYDFAKLPTEPAPQ